MSSRRDMFLALTVAGGLHGIALLSIDLPAGGIASGSGGQASISIAAAAPGLRAVVETWETPPEVALVAASMSAEPLVNISDKLTFATADSVLRRIEPPAQLSGAPDKQPDQFSLPEPIDRALADSQRPPARPAKRGGDEAIVRRVAAGAGGGVTRGQSQDVAAAVAMSPNALKAAQGAWAAAIQRRIARHQRFPKDARGSGRVRLTMIIRSDGQMTKVRVAKSSGDAAFDRAAVRAAQTAAPFPAAPKSLSEPWYNVGQWVSFNR